MYIYIGIEDLVANAIIELVESNKKGEILFRQLTRYGASVVQFISEKNDGKKAVLILSNDRTESFLRDYHEYFEGYSSEAGDGIRLRDNVTLNDLWMKFRCYLSVEVMDAFSSKDSIKELGVVDA